MISLQLPLSQADVRKLKVGDEVSLSGTMVTGRDNAHHWLLGEKRESVSELLAGSAIYHCGPVVAKHDGNWTFVAAGPTTSIREEPFEAEVIANYGIRAVIGKGGMGPKTLAALEEHGAVYLQAVGGAASLIAGSVQRVKDVYMLDEFGVPEAMWVIDVENFRAVVTMDSHGNSLHNQIRQVSSEIARQLLNT